MSYFNADQEAHMECLDRIPLAERCWCGWDLVGQCHGANCKPGLSCADKCLPCYGVGHRWHLGNAERQKYTCPDCGGTGMTNNTTAPAPSADAEARERSGGAQ
jgi:DnaJ-class molecular chaperone